MGDPRAALLSFCEQRETIAACLVLEAGGEGNAGMQAVMNVIQNRAGGNPSNFYAQATRPAQFTSLSSSSTAGFFKDYSPLIAKARHSVSWKTAQKIVDVAFDGKLDDLTRGATHYYAAKKCKPTWAEELDETVVIGAHRFMREPSETSSAGQRQEPARKEHLAVLQ